MNPLIIICAALTGLLVLLLGFWTSISRSRSGVIAHGAARDPASAMLKAERAHGNSAEYAGALIGLFVLVGLVYSDRDLGLWMSGLVIALTAARYVHAIGFLVTPSLAKIHPLKAIGAIITYLGGIALCLTLIAKAL